MRFLLILAFAFSTMTTGPALAEKRVALVIGNGTYKNAPTLPNPLNDAGDLAAALGRLGFAVTILSNATFDDMRRALVAFGRLSASSDVAILYFAGHGMEIGGENWLLPIDAELRRDTDAEGESIGLRTAMLQVANAAKLGLVILDACRNNPFSVSMTRAVRTRAVERGFVRVEPTDNVLVAFAARDGTTASDGDGRNSPFTSALLRNIETPGLELRFMLATVRDDVMTATRREQQPFVYGSLSKDPIYLNPAKSAPATLPQTPAADEIAWSFINSSDLSALRRFAAQFPNSRRRAEAETHIARLTPDNRAKTPSATADAAKDAASPGGPVCFMFNMRRVCD